MAHLKIQWPRQFDLERVQKDHPGNILALGLGNLTNPRQEAWLG